MTVSSVSEPEYHNVFFFFQVKIFLLANNYQIQFWNILCYKVGIHSNITLFFLGNFRNLMKVHETNILRTAAIIAIPHGLTVSSTSPSL